MATATLNGQVCEVRVERDLESNWAISVLSGQRDPVSLTHRPAAPVICKVWARTRWTALEAGLKSLKDNGAISDYTIEARPAEELAAIEAEKARAAARRAAGAKAAEEDA